MKIEYKGINKEDGRDYREAVIEYDEKKEHKKADKVFDYLTENGWELYGEEECIYIRLCDKSEYKYLVEDYKKAKKEV